jgi:hypothetical protein
MKSNSAIRWVPLALVLLMLSTAMSQTACRYVAAGAAGAAIGHEIAKDNDDDD